MPNYSNSIIYKLCCKDLSIQDIYVGSTTNFRIRKCAHKNNCNNESGKKYNIPVYQFIRDNGGWENWDMIQIEAYQATDKRNLETRERYYIELLKPSLNKYIPTRTKAEYQKQHYQQNKEALRKYRQEHKEAIKEYHKKYGQQNKEALRKYRQDNKEAIYQKQKQYRENNKDKIKEKNKKYHEKKKLLNFIYS